MYVGSCEGYIKLCILRNIRVGDLWDFLNFMFFMRENVFCVFVVIKIF